MAEATILIVDDDEAIREVLRLTLELAGYACVEAGDASRAYAAIVDRRPDLMLLDWMMPGSSGVELLRRLRRDQIAPDLPVIMLTAKGEEQQRVLGLQAGADDYVVKPFAARELVARVQAVLRRGKHAERASPLQFGLLSLDPASHRVQAGGQVLHLGPTEFKLLHFFMRHPDRAYSREQLLDQVWGGNVYVEDRTVDVHIRRLRKALQQSDNNDVADYIQTVRGVGYRFSPG